MNCIIPKLLVREFVEAAESLSAPVMAAAGGAGGLAPINDRVARAHALAWALDDAAARDTQDLFIECVSYFKLGNTSKEAVRDERGDVREGTREALLKAKKSVAVWVRGREEPLVRQLAAKAFHCGRVGVNGAMSPRMYTLRCCLYVEDAQAARRKKKEPVPHYRCLYCLATRTTPGGFT